MKLKLFITLFLVFPSFSLANTVGTDFQLFNPSTDGKDFHSVESGRSWHAGHLRLGLFLDIGMNTIPAVSSNPPYFDSTTRKSPEEILFNIIPTANLTIFDWLQVGVVLPSVLNTTIEKNSARIDVTAKGLSDARINLKSSIVDLEYVAFSLVGNVFYDVLENNLFVGDPDDGIGFSVLAALSSHTKDYNFAINFGHKWRDVGTQQVAYSRFSKPIDDQWFGSAAVGAKFDRYDLILETYMSNPIKDFQHALNRDRRSWEILGTFKRGVYDHGTLYVSAGTEVVHGIGSADLRVVAGVDWGIDLWNKGTHEFKSNKIPEKITPTPIAPIYQVYKDDFVEKGKWVVFQLEDFVFASNSTELEENDQTKEKLDNILKYIKNNSYLSIQILGHTDNIGSYDYNALLAKRRAERIKKFLVKSGVDESSVDVISYSYRRPIATNDTEEGRSKNRRVEVRVEIIR